ncbi:MAG: metallophosphoesterase [Acidobacteriota bacterium]|nr:metallophosphoesterase [Acidobacteriota bacterium]
MPATRVDPDPLRRLVGRIVAVAGRTLSKWKRPIGWTAGMLSILLLWGAGIEPRLIDEEWETASVPELPIEWEGARVALIADLQVGMWLANTDTVRRIVERVIDERPAAILIAGDFLYHPTQESGEPREARDELEREDMRELRTQVAEVVSLLQPLTAAGISTFAVLGNHDYAMRRPDSLPLPVIAEELSRALGAIGVTVLRNGAVPLGSRDAHKSVAARVYVAGLDAWSPRASDVEATLAQVPGGAPRLFVMHNPLSFQELPARSAPVALAGHTHGGQIRLPFVKRWSWMSLVRESPVSADGWIAPEFGAPGNRLYVNRGIGFSMAPVRINCPPELTWFVLRRAAQGSGY